MSADVRYQVFISSTYEDLRFERQQATQAILEMNHMPAGMELFPASDLSQWGLIKTVIKDSNYYVVILGGRYGSVSIETGLSFTEMEYDYAASEAIPILGFVRKDITVVPAKYYEGDPLKREKLDGFRAKVLSRICRQYDEPADLGMLVMKSLMNETRTNPKVGWVRADQARNQDDLDREQSLLNDLKQKERSIKRLERELRDRTVKINGILPEQLAQGSDTYAISATFQNQSKKMVSVDVPMTWDEILSVIGPTMYGYIVRRGPATYNKFVGQYSFEAHLVEYVRIKLLDHCANRQISIPPHQIDTILIQLKQLGLLAMFEKTVDDDGESFRGYSLTEAGEERLTRTKIQLSSSLELAA
jgi:hypothetical protein